MAWGVAYYCTESGSAPALDFLAACPANVRAKLAAVLEAVRDAPPPAFSGGGAWEAMHGAMAGYYEIRKTGPGRTHYRLYCILDNGTEEELRERGFDRPHIAVINGLSKPNATLFTAGQYRKRVKALGDDYLSTLPRRIAA